MMMMTPFLRPLGETTLLRWDGGEMHLTPETERVDQPIQSCGSASKGQVLLNKIKYSAGKAWDKEKASYGFGGGDNGATALAVGSKVAGGAIAYADGAAKVVVSGGGRIAARAGIKGGVKAVLGGSGVGAVIAFAPDGYNLVSGFVQGWNEFGR